MSYEKPIFSQQFDRPVYQRLEPKKKTEKKRPFGRKKQRADVAAQEARKHSPAKIVSIRSRKPAASAGGKKSVGSKKRPSSVQSSRRAAARKRRA